MTTTGVIGFTDIVGFTEFTAIQGDGRASELLDLQLQAVLCHLGEDDRVVKELGDGLMLWFSDAGGAIKQALAIQNDLAAAASSHDVPLWVRIGLHWGRPTERGDDLIGHDVNLASRVSDQAGPAEVLVTEELLRAAGTLDDVSAEPLGPVQMKGIPDPVWLWRMRSP